MTDRALVLLGALGLTLVALAGNLLRTLPEPGGAPGAEPSGAEAPEPPLTRPAASDRVADGASALGGFTATLDRMARGWLDDLGIDVHVVTASDPARPVDERAPELFAERRIGAGAPNGGLLVLVDPGRSEARIEVSYELEPVFPDGFVGRLAKDQLVPYASYGFAGMAVMDVLHELKDFAYLAVLRGELALDEGRRARPELQQAAAFLSGGGGARVDLASLPADADLKAPIPAPRRARYAPSKDPLASAEAFVRMYEDLAGDPTLELLTPGSRVQRASYPVAPFEELRRAQQLRASKPWHVVEQGDRAVVDSRTPAPGFVPVLLHREQGLWRVDLAETWKNLMFGADGEYWLQNANTPYAFGLGRFGTGEFHDLAAWELGSLSLDEVVATLRERKELLSRFLLAELLFRNCFASMEALRLYVETAAKHEKDVLLQTTLADRALYLGLSDLAIPALERLGTQGYLGLAEAHEGAGHLPEAEDFARRALGENPYDRAALARLASVLESAGRQDEAAAVRRELQELEVDSERKWAALEMRFDPARPVFDGDTTTLVGDAVVYDHTRFDVALTNRSGRPIEVLRVRVGTAPQGSQGGLGDMRDAWSYPEPGRRIPPGATATLSRTWGFVIDRKKTHDTYVFDVCWRGVGSDVRQCRVDQITAFPL